MPKSDSKDRNRRVLTLLSITVIVFTIALITTYRRQLVEWIMSAPDVSVVSPPMGPPAAESPVAYSYEGLLYFGLTGLGILCLITWRWWKEKKRKEKVERDKNPDTVSLTPKKPKNSDEEEGFWVKYQTWIATGILALMIYVGWREAWMFLVGRLALLLGIVLLIVLFASRKGSRSTATMILTLASLLIMVKVALPSTATEAIKEKWKMVIEGRRPGDEGDGSPKPPVAGRSGVTSRVTSRTIIAKPGVWSERISVPMSQNWNITPEGRIRILTAGGKTWEDWKGRAGEIRRDPSPFDSMFQFMSLEEREVEVIVEWEPK